MLRLSKSRAGVELMFDVPSSAVLHFDDDNNGNKDDDDKNKSTATADYAGNQRNIV